MIEEMNSFTLVSQIEPKNIESALSDESWVNAMHEELHQFERNKVSHLVSKPLKGSVIGTKWVYRNKINEESKIVRNKVRLVTKGYNKKFRINFEESFAPVVRLEVIRILLAYASSKGFQLKQMDVKSTFLNGYIKEDVYVEQPPRFECIDLPNHVYKLDKALYGLKQAPRAWYDRLSSYLQGLGYSPDNSRT